VACFGRGVPAANPFLQVGARTICTVIAGHSTGIHRLAAELSLDMKESSPVFRSAEAAVRDILDE
jgi:hypothetical protein